jgi:catalase
LAHFARERIPERVVHAKGSGAKGVFELTNDMSEYTKADLFNGIGKTTPVLARFSSVAGEQGYPDTLRDVHGFAIRFYTQDGNYDIVGNNTPVFFINDPLKFPDFIHSQKRNPQTGLRDDEMQWDFWSNSPESLHQVTILMSDRGLPYSYANMHGYGSHTFKWVNAKDEQFWVKYHFRSDQGIKNLSIDDATVMVGQDTDWHRHDLFDRIDQKNFPSWTLKVQIIPYEEGLKYKYDIFDVTKVISQKDYPLIDVGKMTLNQNPENFFADIEEAAFSPANMVAGIEPSPDKLLQGRLFSYADAQRYRLGANYTDIPVNKPVIEVENYSRDGHMQTTANHGGQVNYEPNSKNGPTEDTSLTIQPDQLEGTTGAYLPYDQDWWSAPGALYRLLDEQHKQLLIDGIAASLGKVQNIDIQKRQVELFTKADPKYGKRVAEAIDLKP